LIRRVKDRPDCRLFMITRQNRDRLLSEISDQLQEDLRKQTAGPPIVDR
jgi:nucleoside-triphosphatase THEP1